MRNYMIYALTGVALMSCAKSDPMRPEWEGGGDRLAQEFDSASKQPGNSFAGIHPRS